MTKAICEEYFEMSFSPEPKAFTVEEMTNLMLQCYNEQIYKVDKINLLLKALDKTITSFSISKVFDVRNVHEPASIVISFNEQIGITLSNHDITEIVQIWSKDDKNLWLSDLLPEAREKLRAKYLTNITFLEDQYGLPFEEIIKMEL